MVVDTLRTLGLAFVGGFVIVTGLSVYADLALKDRLKNVCCILLFLFGMAGVLCGEIAKEIKQTTICACCQERIDVDDLFCPKCGTEVNDGGGSQVF